MNVIDLSFLANYHLLPQLMQRIYGICNLIILNFLETYLISFRYMLWRNQSGICPPFFYVIIAEKDKLKSLKEFFGLKIKNAVGPLVLQEQVHTVNCWIHVKNLSFCFCSFSVIPWRPVFFYWQHQKKVVLPTESERALAPTKNVWSLWKSCLSLKQESESKYFIFCCELLKYEFFALFEIKKAMEIKS